MTSGKLDETSRKRDPTEGSFDDPHYLLASLNRTNFRGERAENSEELLKFTAEAIAKLTGQDEARQSVKRVVDILSELSRRGLNNKLIIEAREIASVCKNEFAKYLDALVQLDSSAALFGQPVGYFYADKEEVRSELQIARRLLEGQSMSEEQIEAFVHKRLAGEGDSHRFLLPWVLRQLREAPEWDISGMVAPEAEYDRPAGGGTRTNLNIARAVACRRLHDVLPDFAKQKWELQSRLLSWAGLGEVTRNHVVMAVVGNQRRLD